MFENNILVEPYYDIIEEQIIEDTTNKDKPGEIKQETKILPTQKVRYIIDTNIFANEDLVFICRIDSFLDSAKQLLVEYLETLQIYLKFSKVRSFLQYTSNNYFIFRSMRTRIVSGLGGMQYTSVCNPLAQCKITVLIRMNKTRISRRGTNMSRRNLSIRTFC